MSAEKESGIALAHPLPGEEIVITGMAGRFPESDNVYEFSKNIYNKTDMITSDNRRWLAGNPEIPHRTGKISYIDKFDAGYFGMSYNEVNDMDPMLRILLERSYEALLDSGYNIHELANSKVGVFMGSCFSESEQICAAMEKDVQNFSTIGNLLVIANRISHHFQFCGPSISIDTACSSSMYALESAYRAIRVGKCEAALVGGIGLCLSGQTSLQFARLGVLCMDGICKVFDENANGYVRSEAIAVVFLQKMKNSRRIYAQVVHSKTNCDGYKEQGITFPSSSMQAELMKETYADCQLDPAIVDVLEAHATGTAVGDPEEINACDSVFCINRPSPLIIGSVKSYVGHSEAASGMCSLVKALIQLEDNTVLPNLNFKTPTQCIKGIVEGRMMVPVDAIPWPQNGSGIVGVCSYGFGGANVHVVLKSMAKEKINDGLPEDNLPRLICVSGRTKECLQNICDDISGRKLDAEYCRLIQQIFKDTHMNHNYRGYTIHSKLGEIDRKWMYYFGRKGTLLIAFLDAHREVIEIGRQLYNIGPFFEAVQRIDSVLSSEKVCVTKIMESGEVRNASEFLLANLTVQLALANVLKLINFPFDHSTGKSIGVIAAAYMGGEISIEQAILAGCCISKCISDIESMHDLVLETTLQNRAERISDQLLHLFPQMENLINRLLSSSPLEKISGNVTLVTIGSNTVRSIGSSSLSISSHDAVHSFLKMLGSIYMMGYTMSTEMLYPQIKWPVSRGTPMISPLIRWNYDDNWFTILEIEKQRRSKVSLVTLNNKEIDWSFLPGHVIDGLTLMPATGYLFMIWTTYCKSMQVSESSTRVLFENVKFHRATHLSKANNFSITIGKRTDKFEILETGQMVVSGSIRAVPECVNEYVPPSTVSNDKEAFYSPDDIYKELRLRGYNYSGAFRALEKANLSGTTGWIKWEGNWVTFIDNLLQSSILNVDTRNLYVPTFIEHLAIDGPKHVNEVRDATLSPIHNHHAAKILSSGGIEVRGFRATAISRRRAQNPILETYKFVPFHTELKNTSAIRICMQLLLENNFLGRVKVVEVIERKGGENALVPIIKKVLDEHPNIKYEFTIMGNENVTVPDMIVTNGHGRLSMERQYDVVVLEDASSLNDARSALKQNGFVILRDGMEHTPLDFDIISTLKTETEVLTILKKTSGFSHHKIVQLRLNGHEFEWMMEVKEAIKNDEKVLMVVQQEPLSGILGFINCLRLEPGGMHFKCVFIMDPDVVFNRDDPLFSEQLKKCLAINVLRGGVWGTYRHLELESENKVERPHIFNNLCAVGNLSSLTWVEGPLTEDVVEVERSMVQVYCSAINFKDVVVASGRITSDAFTKLRLYQSDMQGVEFSGKDLRGRRVMGIVPTGTLSTLLLADISMVWEIPVDWSMEQAASVPVTYSTALYGLCQLAKMKRGESILIHAAAGGIGQTAINLALSYECDIFITVGTEEKKQFIKKAFPQIPDNHIGNSRNCSFEQMVLKQTRGRGVDIIINSLSEEKLQASLRCLARNGRFVEIGKYDLLNNNKFAATLLSKGCTYFGTMLDLFFSCHPHVKRLLQKIVQNGLDNRLIKPLHYQIYKPGEVEKAYRDMAASKHIGKIIVQIREEGQHSPTLSNAIPRFFCNPHMTYIVIGGLGGLGLELVDWMILRGARKLVLVSRNGVRNGYAASRIKLWKNYQTSIIVSTEDVSSEEGCIALLTNASKLAPIAGIFNLAVTLRDGLFENLTEEAFRTTLSPKSLATLHLDLFSRKLCPNLKYFVMFSSVSCGRGNVGQSNYGMANSIMERVCEKRKMEGLPGLAIQWGPMGEVGVVADMQEQRKTQLSGYVQQRVASFLSCLDSLLTQNEPIVSSIIVAQKSGGFGEGGDIISIIKNLMGITDLKTVSEHTPLPELGMDSMTAIEIKQTLERECDVFLNATDIRTLTFAKLRENLSRKSDQDGKHQNTTMPIHALFKFLGNEEEAKIAIKTLHSAVGECEDAPTVLVLPGFEGTANALEPLANKLLAHVKCVQYVYDQYDYSIQSFAKSLLPLIPAEQTHFNLIAYSYGCIVALELVAMLESEGKLGNVVLIDGSLEMFKEVVLAGFAGIESAPFMETFTLCNLMSLYIPLEKANSYKEILLKLSSLEERVNFVLDLLPNDAHYSKEYRRRIYTGFCLRMTSVCNYKPNISKLKSSFTLFKSTEGVPENYDEDYKLQKYCEKTITINVVDGSHLSVIKNANLASSINDIINNNNNL